MLHKFNINMVCLFSLLPTAIALTRARASIVYRDILRELSFILLYLICYYYIPLLQSGRQRKAAVHFESNKHMRIKFIVAIVLDMCDSFAHMHELGASRI